MKKTLSIILAVLMILALAAGCGAQPAPASPSDVTEPSDGEETVLRVGASVTPHAEILAQVVDKLAEQGIKLEIVEYTDYVQPNLAVEDGSLDANYFQHQPYLDTFNENYDTHLVSVAKIHYEPFGIYAGKTGSLDELADGATIAVPNDGSNETRALLLLRQEGLITLKDGIDASSNATILDIAENPKNLVITEMEAAQIALALKDIDLGVINGNYALQAGLKATEDALALEDASGDGAQTYGNIICVKEGNESNEAVLALIEALADPSVGQWITENYEGAVVPLT
ncbi:MAG: MetQ/NlpA family ABC transporter substrate-binding protein [Candidatus Onthomonas sp.]|nr:MetQ/NlpA family ABC transporter substrate-binding protein [Candidatus Onthomonas sp.]